MKKENQKRMQKPFYGSIINFLNGTESEESKQSKENPDEFNRDFEVIINEPWEYDFKYEYFNNGHTNRQKDMTKYWNLDEEPDNIKRFLKYKVDEKNEFDCDGTGEKNACKLTREIYRRLWNWEDNNIKRYGTIGLESTSLFGPDTMNSFMTLLRDVLEAQEENNILNEYREIIKNIYQIDQAHVSKLFLYRLIIEQDVKLKKYINDEFDLWVSFAKIHHFIGNFVLVPAGFNTGREENTHDYWDSSLVWLKKDGFVSEKTTFNKEDFTKYINYFFLWDYVEPDEADTEKKTYKIKPLFQSHSDIEKGDDIDKCKTNWTNITSPEEAEEFMSNATNFITRRGIFMTAMLRLQAEIDDTEYGKLRDEVFAADTCYKSFEAVIEIILKRLKNNGITDTLNTLKAEQEWKTVIEHTLKPKTTNAKQAEHL